MKIDGLYNWKHDKANILIYMGRNRTGRGFWHQFSKVDEPEIVWCEVLDHELNMIEEFEGEKE